MLQSSAYRLAIMGLILSSLFVCSACGASTNGATAGRGGRRLTGPAGATDAARHLTDLSAPQSPADPPQVIAMQPDLPPGDGPLVATPVQTPPDTGSQFQAGRSLNLPPGFQASVYAVTGGGPRFMAISPDGTIFVTLMERGQVVELVPSADGLSAQPHVVLNGLKQPHGIAFFGGYLHVGETNQIARFPYSDGQVQESAKAVIVPDLPTGGHSTRTVDFGPDGLMYVSIGSSCNVCIEQDQRHAAVSVYNSDGTGGRIYASGLRNAVGLAWQPGTGDLWATVNGRDEIGADMGLSGAAATIVTDNLPPDYVTKLSDGANYGWPRCYGNHELDPKYGDAAFCAGSVAPSIEIQAHSAPLGLGFYTGSSFPATYQGDLFVSLHGSWDRSLKTGYKVVRVKFPGGQPVGVEDFATGWLTGNQAWGRPVDLVTGSDGALYISDDAGVIYRIAYTIAGSYAGKNGLVTAQSGG
ncbi:MAG: PQQ-dependent sugar dehydrogenase [Dehalococcoidia bacterium]